MATKGRAFTSLSPEDQQIIANGISRPDGGSWRNIWNTNDIDNEFSTMDKWFQDDMLTRMNDARKQILTRQLKNDNDQAAFDQAWAPYGGAPAGGANAIGGTFKKGTTGYVPKTDGSDAWKFKGDTNPTQMKNPVFIGGQYYDMPKTTAAAPAAPAAPNLSGGQASVPTVAQRMSRMGMAVAKGVGKGSIGMNQLNKYIPPGTTIPAVPAAPAAPTSPLVNQLAPKPVPMPQGNLLGKATY